MFVFFGEHLPVFPNLLTLVMVTTILVSVFMSSVFF